MLIESRESMALHRRVTVVDLAVETLTWARLLGYDPVRRHHVHRRSRVAARFNQADLPRMRDAGLDGAAFGIVVWPWPGGMAQLGLERSLELLRWMARRAPYLFLVADKAQDIRGARRSKRVAGIPLLRGAQGLGKGRRREVLGRLGLLRDQGLRIIEPVHGFAGPAGSPRSGVDADSNARLTGFGRDLVAECERQRILVDLACISKAGLLESCALSRVPVVISHAAVAALHSDAKNLSDEELIAVADTGGVIGITLDPRRLAGHRHCTLDAVVDHASYVADLVGPDHVGLGSYIDGFLPGLPDSMRSIADLPMLTDRLFKRGWSEEHIEAFLGGNALRVLEWVCG